MIADVGDPFRLIVDNVLVTEDFSQRTRQDRDSFASCPHTAAQPSASSTASSLRDGSPLVDDPPTIPGSAMAIADRIVERDQHVLGSRTKRMALALPTIGIAMPSHLRRSVAISLVEKYVLG